MRAGGKTLICQRPGSTSHAGLWEFPGGKLQQGESEAECLAREIMEELGCHILPLDLIMNAEHEYPGKAVSLGFYRAIPLEGLEAKFIPREGQGVRWVETAELPKMDLLPADRPIAEFLAQGARCKQ